MTYHTQNRKVRNLQSAELNVVSNENEDSGTRFALPSKSASKKNIHWLDVYRQRVSDRCEAAEILPAESMKANVSQEPALPKTHAVGADAGNVSGSGRYLVNQGSEPVGIEVMKSQVKRAAIYVYNIKKENATEMISDIIRENKRVRRNEYIFAFSERKGLRVLARGGGMGFNKLAFHHQNIFTGRGDILSAGTIYVGKNKIFITNFSGHFKPSVDSLSHVERFLTDAGVSKKKFKISDYTKVASAMRREKTKTSHWYSQFFCGFGGS
ncbi:hypothetical protein ACR9GP_21335 [Enterobacter ludwigii]